MKRFVEGVERSQGTLFPPCHTRHSELAVARHAYGGTAPTFNGSKQSTLGCYLTLDRVYSSDTFF